MGRLNEFELTIRKTKDSPLTYEALIPSECNFFQDVRRFQSIEPTLEFRIIPVNGTIELDPDMEPISINKLNGSERKALAEYLTVRVARGDNIGSAYAFFQSPDRRKPIIAYGGNVVHNDTAVGKERVRELLALLQKKKGVSQMRRRWLPRILVGLLIFAVIFAGLKYGHLAKRFPFKRSASAPTGQEMEFYQSVFPNVSEWLTGDNTAKKEAAQALLKPEYIAGIRQNLGQEFYQPDHYADMSQGNRLILFVYFNYNTDVAALVNTHRGILADTEFMRLARIYSTRMSGYASNIFYFKVGGLDIKHAEISRFMKQNMITFRDYKKIRDADAFSTLMENNSAGYKMKGFLENVYTFTPLLIKSSLKNRSWFLLTRRAKDGTLDFAAFFHKEDATLVPKRIGNLILGEKRIPENMTWYALDEGQAEKLRLSDNALTHFSRETGQIQQLGIIENYVKTLGLEPADQNRISVSVHRELLMGDVKGKYGIQTNDPITSLVLSNLITKDSFEREASVSLKRDPIQFNTTLVQLSKDDSFSVQSVTITPGTTNIIRLFEPLDSFRAIFSDGTRAVFEKASVNLFNPFTFMISRDSITFSFRHDIKDMEIDTGDVQLKIVKAGDGNYQIVEAM